MASINESALISSLHFHGPELARFIASSIAESGRKTSSVALEMVQTSLNRGRDQRDSKSTGQSELKTAEERNFAKRLQRFVAQKFPALYQQEDPKDNAAKTAPENLKESCADRDDGSVFGACPSLETFLDISGKKLKERFFAGIRPGDCLCGEIRSVEEFGVIVRLLCVDSPTMQRDLEDLRLDVFLPKHELAVLKLGDDPFSIYCKHKLVRAVVSAVNPERHHLTIVLKSADSLDTTSKRLGIILEDDLPAYFRASREEGSGATFDDKLRHSEGFLNPHCVDNLCLHFGIPVRSLSSLSQSLISAGNDKSGSAKELRKMQSYRLAMKSVVKGIERLRSKQNAEAMQHFNKALDIDPENVEGLVGRGALYANCESYEMAVRDFEQALRFDANHANARLYLTETLLAQRKAKDDDRSRRPPFIDRRDDSKRPQQKRRPDADRGTSRPAHRRLPVSESEATKKNGIPSTTSSSTQAKPAEDVKLERQLSDMEKFIAGLKAKAKQSSDKF